MAEKQTSRNIIRITEDAVKKFLAGVATTQKGILRRVNGTLRQLELKAGAILPNQFNIRLKRELEADLPSLVVDNAYKARVDTYLRNFDKIKRESDSLFKATLAGFNSNKQVYKEILNDALSLTRKSLLETGINSNVIDPIINIVNSGITSGAQISDMEETLRTQIIGDQNRLGGLERYSSQITRDALNQYSANYNESVSGTENMEWYFYSGTIIEDSRSYCIARAGKYFHKKEVEKVPQQWDGRIPGTNSSNIFINRGGFNCRHLYLPVLINVVPKDVIERNIRNGNFSP